MVRNWYAGVGLADGLSKVRHMADEGKGDGTTSSDKGLTGSGDLKRGTVIRPTGHFKPESAPASPAVPAKPADSGGASKGE